MNKYGLYGKLIAKKGSGEKLASILLEAAEIVSQADGCYLYLVSANKINQDEIWVTEVWDSKDAHDNSLNLSGVKELISKAIPLLEGLPEKGIELNILGGHGIDIEQEK
jgi:quinol monooxygenase YgiN